MIKRTFIAVKISVDKDLKSAIDLLRKGLAKEKIRWIDDHNMHITLAFIGDTHEKTIKDIISMLDSKLKGSGRIAFGLRSFGVFKNFRDPRVIFTAIENPENLMTAFITIKSGLEGLGIKIEEREFKPHLTLGRVKFLSDTDNLKVLLSKFENVKFQDVIVDEIIYYESILRPEGPEYKPLQIICLRK
jgi:RNA 2',3'-cyclic 3'-phosphodiesterase